MGSLAALAVRRDHAIRMAREEAARKWTRARQEMEAAIAAAEREYERAERVWWAGLEQKGIAA